MGQGYTQDPSSYFSLDRADTAPSRRLNDTVNDQEIEIRLTVTRKSRAGSNTRAHRNMSINTADN